MRRNRAAMVAIGGFVVLLLGLVLALSSVGGEPGPATGAAALVPGDALAYVHLSTDSTRPAVQRGRALADRLPDHLLPGTMLLARLSTVLGGGTTVDFRTDIRPWLGKEAGFALLSGSGASVIVLDVRAPGRARSFVTRAGAVAAGRYGPAALYRYPSGTELAFVGHYLVAGQAAAVQASVDAFTRRSQPLMSNPMYSRAAAGEPPDRVLDAYISAAGVRRVLLARGGLPAALGVLVSQQGAGGTTVSVSPAAPGAQIRIHSAVPAVPAGSGGGGGFTPTLAGSAPSNSLLMLDVARLDRAAPAVLGAVAQTGIGGAVAPLLGRLGAALSAEGVDIRRVLSIFDREGVVAIGPSHSLILITRASSDAATILAELQQPLAQLFPPPTSGPGQAPVWGDHQVAGVTAHQISLAPGLQLNYAVFNGLVVISTSLSGIGQVASRAHALTSDPAYVATLGNRPDRVSSLLFLDFSQLLNLADQIGLTRGSLYGELQPDLRKIRAVGLVSTRGEADTTAELTLQIP